MSREIKFRALKDDISNCNFVYGQLIYDAIGVPIITQTNKSGEELIFQTCIKGTESQFTGLKDKNNVEIYEGDKVRILYADWSSKSETDPRTLEQYLIDIASVGEVVFNDNSWEIKFYSKKYDDYSCSSISCGRFGYIEVIGNIYDNPNLLT